MSVLYETIASLCSDRGITGYRMCKDVGIRPSILTDLKQGRKKSVTVDTAIKIANYFNVDVSYLLGNEEKAPFLTKKARKDNPTLAINNSDDKKYIDAFFHLLSNLQEAEKLSEADVGAALYAALIDGTIITDKKSKNVENIKQIYECFKTLLNIPPELRNKILNSDNEDI